MLEGLEICETNFKERGITKWILKICLKKAQTATEYLIILTIIITIALITVAVMSF